MRLLHRLWHTQAICVPTRAQYANDTLSGIKHGKRWFARSPYLAERSTEEASGEIEPDSGSTTASKGRSHQWRPTPEYEYVRKEGRRVSRKSRRQEIFGLTPRAKASTGTSLWITLTDFERLAKEGKATLEDADACLRYHRANIEALPFGERRKACLELNTGRQVLYWVMGQQNGMPADVDDKRRFWNHGFCPNLMWHIIGEGLEEAIFDWIRIVSKQDTRSFALESNLLGSLANAYHAWEPNGSPDSALRCFKRAVEFRRALVTHDDVPISVMGIGLTISTILESESCPPANEELFQFYFDAAHLVQQFGKYTQHDTLRSQLEKPILALFHPTKPDGSLLLNELKHATRPGRRLETHAFWAAYRPSTRYAFASWLFRLSYILRLQGNSTDADWIDACLEHKVPDVWKETRLLGLQSDRRLDGLRQKAYPLGAPIFLKWRKVGSNASSPGSNS